MARKFLIVWLCIIAIWVPGHCLAGSSEITDSGYWSSLVHQENSLIASILYVPYIVLMVPYRMIDGIVSPKPTSQATMPPAAHRAAH